MQLNFNHWLSSLDCFTKSLYTEGCSLTFPLLDKTAKIRFPNEKSNKKRITLFISEELENIISLGTGLRINFDDNSQKIILGNEGIGEIFYRIRCSLLHEAEVPDNITFTRISGCFSFVLTPASKTSAATISVPSQFMEILLIVLLGCPEYNSINKEFNGLKIKFNNIIIIPSQCVGNFEELTKQLFFGPN